MPWKSVQRGGGRGILRCRSTVGRRRSSFPLTCLISPRESNSSPSRNPLYWKWTWSTINRPELSKTNEPTQAAEAAPVHKKAKKHHNTHTHPPDRVINHREFSRDPQTYQVFVNEDRGIISYTYYMSYIALLMRESSGVCTPRTAGNTVRLVYHRRYHGTP